MNVTFVILLVLWLWKGGFTCYMYVYVYVCRWKVSRSLESIFPDFLAKCLCVFLYIRVLVCVFACSCTVLITL